MNLFKILLDKHVMPKAHNNPIGTTFGSLGTLALTGSIAAGIAIIEPLISRSIIILLGILALCLLGSLLIVALDVITSQQKQIAEAKKEPEFITELALKFKKTDIINGEFLPYCPKPACPESQLQISNYDSSSSSSYKCACPNCELTIYLKDTNGRQCSPPVGLAYIKQKYNL